jgi:uncharacterized protein (DUF1697 family)
VALLRGANVGGRRRVVMADLRAALEAGGYRDVRTVIASGNVLFATDAVGGTVDAHPDVDLGANLEANLEELLLDRLQQQLLVVVRTHDELRAIVEDAPAGFGTLPETHHSDVAFLKAPLNAAEVMRVVQRRDGVDEVWPGDGVVYFQRLSARLAQSKMSTIVGTAPYQAMTMRSWSTTTRLLRLLDEAAA